MSFTFGITLMPQSLQAFLNAITQCTFFLAMFLSLAHYCGWIHRLLWFLLEKEMKKALNGTLVTIGGLQVDFFRGRLWVTNAVVHSPRRDEWKWDSPTLVRMGSIYVEANLLLCLMSLVFLQEERNVDIYTVVVSDIQVFVERRYNFFNFFLCDPKIVLPDDISSYVGERGEAGVKNHPNGVLVRTDHTPAGTPRSNGHPSAPAPVSSDKFFPENNVNNPHSQSESSLSSAEGRATEEKAQLLMDDMVRAIHRAAKEGFTIQEALVEHRDHITSHLKALQGSQNKVEVMKEGVEIVQHVSKAVQEKTQTVQKTVQPVKRERGVGEKVDLVRIGRIRIASMRIFTQDHWGSLSSTTNTSADSMQSNTSHLRGQWSKPILIDQVDIHASELCPALSAKDEDGLPALHQPMDNCMEVVWKRVLAESAKSNTGRLFKTAMGEVLDFYWLPPNKESSSTATHGGKP